tara:strand:+ start:1066 stop:1707 length:642 start_codon:yes stop_codon:yes gene_type:complete
MNPDLHPLLAVLMDYYHPEKKTVSQIEKNGVRLDYVGHAEITKILIEIDPEWSWQPVAWENGRPATQTQLGKITKRDGTVLEFPTVSMWGYLTLLGVTRIAVGSVEAHKADLDKELVSDFLRNAAMRFGIALALWTKGESKLQEVVNAHRQTNTVAPATLVRTPEKPRTTSLGQIANNAPSEAQLKYLRDLNYEGPAPETRAECTALIKRLAP